MNTIKSIFFISFTLLLTNSYGQETELTESDIKKQNELVYKAWVNVTGSMSDDIFTNPNRGVLKNIADARNYKIDEDKNPIDGYDPDEFFKIAGYEYRILRDFSILKDGTGNRFMELDKSYVELTYEERSFKMTDSDNIGVRVDFYDEESGLMGRSYVVFKENEDSVMWVGNVTPIFYNKD